MLVPIWTNEIGPPKNLDQARLKLKPSPIERRSDFVHAVQHVAHFSLYQTRTHSSHSMADFNRDKGAHGPPNFNEEKLYIDRGKVI